MSTIATINATDLISDSRTDINTNFSNLNTDKEEVANKDTDTTLAANSDTKYPSQKAIKAYVLANVNPTGASWNEYAADAGATDAYVITLTGVAAYATGQTFKFKANTANTGAATLKVNSLSAITIKKDVSTDLATGDILANQIVTVIYDGTNMQLASQLSGTLTSLAIPVVVNVYTPNANRGSDTTRFDITEPVADTMRYTWDGTGTDPTISAANFPINSYAQIYAPANFNIANNGVFLITGSGANYFEVTNASGVAENDKTLGTAGYVGVGSIWTKPAGLRYAVIEVQGGGGSGGGSGNTGSGGGGGAGGYSKKTIVASSLSSTEAYIVGNGGSAGPAANHGYIGYKSIFKTYVGNGGNLGQANGMGGKGGTGTGGDLNSTGGGGSSASNTTGSVGGSGGSSMLGGGGAGLQGSSDYDLAAGNNGGGGGGVSGSGIGNTVGGIGGDGVIIVTEFY